MLDKLKFNNLIITNKKKIRQGRIQTINKLVQKIRKLKSQLEKHPENPRNKDRLRKTAENLEYLKKLSCSDAVKKVLLIKSPSTVITNGLSTPEEVALALLAQNKIIEDLIKIFKDQLHLSETDLKWREELLEPSKRRVKINRTEEKKKKRKDVKEQKANERKRLDWIKQNNPYVDEDVGLSATGAWKIEHIESEIEHPPFSIRVPSLDNINSNVGNEIKDHKMEIDIITEKVKSKKIKPTMFQNNVDKNTETKAEKIYNKIKSKHVNSDISTIDSDKSNKIKNHEKEVVQKEEEEPIVSHVVDPFFITETGENYLATAVNLPKTSHDSGNKQFEINERSLVAKKAETYTGSKRRFEKNKRHELNTNSTKNFAHDKHEICDNKSLHPSWAAKQKLKPVITSFQGKKITFDDDDIDSAYIKRTVETKKAGNTKFLNNNAVQDNLHPSWAAKQKLKPTIAAFQGKRISFTNEYDD